MSNLFDASRLKLARDRRKMTYKTLGEKCGMSSKMLSMYEKFPEKHQPSESAIHKISMALNFPVDFFYEDTVEDLEFESVAFRSLKSIRAAQQNAALGSGQLGIMLSDYFSQRFSLPSPQIPDLSHFYPEEAAQILRKSWGLGDKGVSNMINLVEAHGVKVFSISENAREVDAFSFWKGKTPFIFLNNQKTGERSRFDCAHELGHLVLHQNSDNKGKDIEKEADRFASEFLMPESSIRYYVPDYVSVRDILALKLRWKVSAMALTYRLKHLEMLSEWQYRSLVIELSQLGYRTGEPHGIDREKSTLIEKLLNELSADRTNIVDIAKQLKLPVEEITTLVFKFSMVNGSGKGAPSPSIQPKKPNLYIV